MSTANVDPRELDKFTELAHRWWDPTGEFRPLHEINPLRLGWIERCTAIAGKHALDVGCGGGILTEALSAKGANVTGIDLSDRTLNVASLHLLESGLSVAYRQVSAEQLAQEAGGTYDIVTCMEMLEHVPQPESSVRACALLAKPGADVFFSTLSRNLKSYLFAVLGAEYILRLLPRGTHDYDKLIRPSELAALCRAAGLEVQDMVGMHYNPITRRYRLGRDTSVNYMVHCRKPHNAA